MFRSTRSSSDAQWRNRRAMVGPAISTLFMLHDPCAAGNQVRSRIIFAQISAIPCSIGLTRTGRTALKGVQCKWSAPGKDGQDVGTLRMSLFWRLPDALG